MTGTDDFPARLARALGWEWHPDGYWLSPFASRPCDLPDPADPATAALIIAECERRGWGVCITYAPLPGRMAWGALIDRDPDPRERRGTTHAEQGETWTAALARAFVAAVEAEG